ncbi:MAG: hypothetical protein ACE5OZ_22345 [Candidatus Heimdallarchaeota archaeon]
MAALNGHEHLHLPILTIGASTKIVDELFEYLRQNKIEISTFNESFGKKSGYISLEKRTLYVSVEQGIDERQINFYELDASFHPVLLKLILHFVQENGLRIITNRIGKLVPHDFPPIEE